MGLYGGINLCDSVKTVVGCAGVLNTATNTTPINVGLAKAVDVVIITKNTTAVTGSAITLKQSTNAAYGGSKALAFTRYYACTDTTNSDAYVLTNASSNTFTTGATNSINFAYVIPVDPATLDTANGFNYLSVNCNTSVNATFAVFYNVVPTYGANLVNTPTLIT